MKKIIVVNSSTNKVTVKNAYGRVKNLKPDDHSGHKKAVVQLTALLREASHGLSSAKSALTTAQRLWERSADPDSTYDSEYSSIDSSIHAVLPEIDKLLNDLKIS